MVDILVQLLQHLRKPGGKQKAEVFDAFKCILVLLMTPFSFSLSLTTFRFQTAAWLVLPCQQLAARPGTTNAAEQFDTAMLMSL